MCIAGAGGRKRSVHSGAGGERGVCIAGAGGRKRSVYSWREKEECV